MSMYPPPLYKLFDAVIHTQESTHKVPTSASQAVLSRIQVTLHATRRKPHGALRLVQAMSAWVVKPDVVCPGIVGMRESVHTTMAMHDNEYPPSTLLL